MTLDRKYAASFLLRAFVLVLFSIALPTSQADAQSQKRGFHPAGSYDIGDIETINTKNGNISLNLPITDLPAGRGGDIGAKVRLNYNNKIWNTSWNYLYLGDDSAPTDTFSLIPARQGNWRYGWEYTLEFHARGEDDRAPELIRGRHGEILVPPCSVPENVYSGRLEMVFPDGSSHVFHPFGGREFGGFTNLFPDGHVICSLYEPPPGSQTFWYTTDGTYAKLVVDSDGETGVFDYLNNPWTLYLADGSRVTGGANPHRIYDRNNNYIEIQNITSNSHPATRLVDQLDRSIIVEYDAAANQDYVYKQGANNEQLRWTIKWKDIHVRRAYDISPDPRLAGGGIDQGFRVVDQIILPAQTGGLSYTFGYAADNSNPSLGWGEINSVTLPSGAQTTYAYPLDGQYDSVGSGTVINYNMVMRKNLTYQREYDGSSSPITETWTYNYVTSGTLTPYTEVTGPDGGKARDYFDLCLTCYPLAGLEPPYKTVQPNGNVVERIWERNIPHDYLFRWFVVGAVPTFYPDENNVNLFVKTEFTSVEDAHGNLTKTAIKDYNYDKNGNVTLVAEYDWVDYGSIPRGSNGRPTGIPAGLTPKRVVVNTYYNTTPDASDTTTDNPYVYHNPASPNLKRVIESSETISDSGSVLSRSESFYDNPSTTGNQTMERKWDSIKGEFSRPLSAENSISVTHQYDSYGNCTQTTDANNVITRYIYGAINGHENLYATETKVAADTTVQQWTTQSYDFNTGMVTQSTDMNNNITTRTTYDVFGRPTLVQEQYGITGVEQQTATEYSDTQRRVIVRSDLNATGDGKLITVEHYDQLGRIRLARKLESGIPAEATDETKGIKTQTRYFAGDAGNQNSYELVSAPYRAGTSGEAGGEPGMAWKRTKFDKGGRVNYVETFVGATPPFPWGGNSVSTGYIMTEYDADITTATDQAFKRRRSQADALGRLIKVIEAPGELNYETSYSYDALNNLRLVTQGTQTRSFDYSSLSRLTSATNPENGTVKYTYDSNGNLVEKIDAREVKTTMTYDALNRVKSKVYSGTTSEATAVANLTPAVNYFYDTYTGLPSGAPSWSGTPSKGKLVGVTYGPGSEGTYYKYDAAGRIVTNHQRMGTSNYVTTYTYNFADGVTREDRGSPARRKNWMYYDDAGRLLAMQSGIFNGFSFEPRDLVNNISYTSFGRLQSETYGNGLIHSMAYNSRHQPVETRLGRANDLESVFRIGYIYGIADNVNVQDAEITPFFNNGNVARIKYFISGNLQYAQTFQYDPINRLSYAVEHNNGVYNDGERAWYQTFAYDPHGNRGIKVENTSDNADGANTALQLADFSEANNRITHEGYLYDTSGNLIAENGNSYKFDAENRIVRAEVAGGATSQYLYDGNSRRVKKIVGGVGTRYEYGAGGELIAEWNDADAPNKIVQKDYFYKGGELLATSKVGNSALYEYAAADGLGTPRAWTDDSGAMIAGGRHDYLPFGAELFADVGTRTTDQGYATHTQQDGQRKQFSSKERDAETGLDYFLARHYSSTQGRFISPDEFTGGPDELYDFAEIASDNPNFYADLTDPQSLNKYQYCYNNPLNYVDADGHSGTVIGAIIGGVVGGTVAIVQGKSAREVIASAAGGAVTGALIGSIVDTGGATLIVGGALAGAAGGMTERLIAGKGNSVRAVATDMANGAGGVMLGAVAGKLAPGVEKGIRNAVARIPRRVPNNSVVVRGGIGDVPAPGTKFSGSFGKTLEDAGTGVPNNQVRVTTAGAIRNDGGTVRSKPELNPKTGVINRRHVNVTEGRGPTTFSPPQKNPIPPERRVY